MTGSVGAKIGDGAGGIIVGLIEHLGDIVACEPVSRYLRASYPDEKITWVVSAPYRDLIDANPHVDETRVVDCLTDWIKLTKHESFTRIVDLHVNLRVCEHCRIPLFKRSGNPFVNAYQWFDYGSLLEAFSLGAGLPVLSGHPLIHTTQAHRTAVDALNLPERFCVVHLESNNVDKDWLPEKWEKLLRRITDELGLPIVEVGGGRRSNEIALPTGSISLFNRIPILHSAEVIRRAAVFIGIDSGPAHLANAAKVPAVILLGKLGFFRSYTPYSGYYASDAQDVKLVRSLGRPVGDIAGSEVWEAVSYIARLPKLARPVHSGPRPVPGAPAASFDAGWYAAQYEDVLASSMTPRDHFAAVGQTEGRPTCPDGETGARLRQGFGAAMSGDVTAASASSFRVSPVAGPSPRAQAVAGAPRTFAFYLPQFHPIPENDWAHGPGFSEWHNVVKAKPLFTGHYQPRIPGELGYYDLRATSVLDAQIDLARQYGIDGFCFYYYYFAGKKLLHDPLAAFLNSKHDVPFLYLWANENWSKRWDGGDREVIIAQKHSAEDDAIFLDELLPVFDDPRYVRIDGKPVLMVYKVHLLENAIATTERWRRAAERHGFPGLYLVMVDDWTPQPQHPRVFGFDAAYEIPANIIPEEVTKSHADMHGLEPGFEGRIVDYERFARLHASRPAPDYKRFRTVMLPWDNTARYGNRAIVHVNGDGSAYRLWLTQVLIDSMRRHPPDERLVFLHSWNEWCEGTYLEPDGRNRRFFLEETARAITTARRALAAAGGEPDDASMISDLFEAMALRDEIDHRLDRTMVEAKAALHNYVQHMPPRDAAERELQAVYRSTSWRVTAPLRAVRRLMRRP